jgi:hypothetical protein
MTARRRGGRLVVRSGETRSAAIALVIASTAGCSNAGPYDYLADRAEEVRELRFVDEVPYRTLTPEQFRDEVSQDVDTYWSDAGLREYADIYAGSASST